MKPVRLSQHAAGYAGTRGLTAAEVEQAIRTWPWVPAEFGRFECRSNLPYGKEWHGKIYQTKQVRPIFVEQHDEILIVTVYTYYF